MTKQVKMGCGVVISVKNEQVFFDKTRLVCKKGWSWKRVADTLERDLEKHMDKRHTAQSGWWVNGAAYNDVDECVYIGSTQGWDNTPQQVRRVAALLRSIPCKKGKNV